MVSILEELRPSDSDSCVSFDIKDKFVVPYSWLYYHYMLDNIEVTKSLTELRRSKRLTDKVIAELLTDFALMSPVKWMKSQQYTFIFCDWKGDRKWRGLLPTQSDTQAVLFKLGESTQLYSFYNTVYKYDDELESVEVTCGPMDELSYNNSLSKYCDGRFPIRLKSLAPMYGEDSVILG